MGSRASRGQITLPSLVPITLSRVLRNSKSAESDSAASLRLCCVPLFGTNFVGEQPSEDRSTPGVFFPLGIRGNWDFKPPKRHTGPPERIFAMRRGGSSSDRFSCRDDSLLTQIGVRDTEKKKFLFPRKHKCQPKLDAWA